MEIHNNAALTMKQRKSIKSLYATGQHSMQSLAEQFGTTRKTISKWVKRESTQDRSSAPKARRIRITPEFEQAVVAYRSNEITAHHGVIRIAEALKKEHACANPSNVYLVLKRLRLSRPRVVKPLEKRGIPVGKHRTQMDIQQLPAIEGKGGFEYKISIIHLSTRIKYSEIHDNYNTTTIAKVYENAIERLPPFL